MQPLVLETFSKKRESKCFVPLPCSFKSPNSRLPLLGNECDIRFNGVDMYEQDDGAIITELVWADAGHARCPMLCEAIITQTRPWCSHISNTIIRLLNSVEKSCSVDWAAQRIKSPETIWLQFDNALNETLNNFLPWHLLKLQNTSGNRYWQYYTAIHGALAGPRQWRIVIDIKKGCLHPGWYLEPYGIAGTVTYLTQNYLKSGVWRSRGWQLVFLLWALLFRCGQYFRLVRFKVQGWNIFYVPL